MKQTLPILATAILILSITGCKKNDTGPSTELKKSTISNYSAIVYANYSDMLLKAEILKQKVEDFVAAPDQSKFDQAKQAWIDARLPYGQSEVYRFSDGPIDDADGPEGLLNAWPLDEAYIDYVQGSLSAGIINKPASYPTINKQLIQSLNESGGETNISCGYHTIEFLLWGQDFDVAGPGNRPYTDYLTTGGTASNQERRGQYLVAAAQLLVDNIQSVTNEWAPSVSSNYRYAFENASPDESLRKIIQGIGFLAKGELAGERIEVAYDSQLQEDEQSCFSDNTHNDIRMNALAINNVFFGTYTKSDGSVISGNGIYEIIKAKDASLAEEAKVLIEKSKTDAYAIAAPFDQQILGSNPTGRQLVHTCILSLKQTGDKIAESAEALGLFITIE